MSEDFVRKLRLAQHATDRRDDLRSQSDLVENLLAADTHQIVLISKTHSLISNGQLHTVTWAEIDAMTDGSLSQAELIFLGESTVEQGDHEVGTSFLAIDVTEHQDKVSAIAGAEWVDLRLVGDKLSHRDTGLFTQALAMVNWHASHGSSSALAGVTEPAHSGWVRTGVSDSTLQVFPRTDSAVIVLVLDDRDRLLLGNNANWEPNRYSLLAGFVEPGESLESAVIREIKEESGLDVVNPKYLGSQPWPFPASLMMGFEARVAPGVDPEVFGKSDAEIRDLRWFSRDELKASLSDVILPGKIAIARLLIEHWLGEELPDDDPLVPRA